MKKFLFVLPFALSFAVVSAQPVLRIRDATHPAEPVGQSAFSIEQSLSLRASVQYDYSVHEKRPLPYPWEAASQPKPQNFAISEQSQFAGGLLNEAPLEKKIEIEASNVLWDRKYQLFYADVVTGVWQPAGEPIVSYSFQPMIWTDVSTAGMRYYRVSETRPSNPPNVTITSPSTGTTWPGYGVLEIHATASAAIGKSVQYAFLFDNQTNKIGAIYGANLQNLSFPVSPQFFHPGEHTFRIFVADDSDADGSESTAWSEPITVSLDHNVWFHRPGWYDQGVWDPDAVRTAGKRFSFVMKRQRPRPYIPGNRIYDVIRVKDPAGNTVLEYVNDSSYAEFWSPFYDSQGHEIYAPEPYYDVIVELNHTTAFADGDDEDLENIFLSYRCYIEQEWPDLSLGSRAVVGKMDVLSEQNSIALNEAMGQINGKYSEAYTTAGGENPLALNTAENWDAFADALQEPTARTLFYFGHGGDRAIGSRNNPATLIYLTDADLLGILGNYQPFNQPLGNEHPYRSAVIWACNAGSPKGNVFEALLGVRQDIELNYGHFFTHGIPPRAGIGFSEYKFLSVANIPIGDMTTAMTQFVNGWSETDVNGNYLRGIKDAAILAETLPTGGRNFTMRAYRIMGDPTLKFE